MKTIYKKIIILVIPFVILLVGLFYFWPHPDQIDTDEPLFAENTEFSRLTFFNARPVRASLAIPAEWEGNYRLKEQSDQVIFTAIVDPTQAQELFRIKAFSMDEWERSKASWSFLLEKSGEIYAYKLSTAPVDKLSLDKEYNKMLKQSSVILDSFKLN